MYIIFSTRDGRQIVRHVAAGNAPELMRTRGGGLGCWNCGGSVSVRTCTPLCLEVACTECAASLAVGLGNACNKVSLTQDGAMVARPVLFSPDDPQNCMVTATGDLALFARTGDPDFSPSLHDPIHCTALDVHIAETKRRSKERAAA